MTRYLLRYKQLNKPVTTRNIRRLYDGGSKTLKCTVCTVETHTQNLLLETAYTLKTYNAEV